MVKQRAKSTYSIQTGKRITPINQLEQKSPIFSVKSKKSSTSPVNSFPMECQKKIKEKNLESTR